MDHQKSLYSTNDGFVVLSDNDSGDGESITERGTLTSVPYYYTLLGSGNATSGVVGTAGQTLSF